MPWWVNGVFVVLGVRCGRRVMGRAGNATTRHDGGDRCRSSMVSIEIYGADIYRYVVPPYENKRTTNSAV